MKSPFICILLTATTLSLLPSITLGQAPNLGTAANFVFFSTIGAVTNAGISQITGNIGANDGAISGWAGITGVVDSENAVTAQAALDLLVAYTQLNADIPTAFPGVILGNGQVLDSGVYSIGAATSLNLGLTLDAQGNPNAVFIFKILGAFSTNANSKVYLINGASACNVYWKVEGAISMAAGSVMRGNLIANNAAISLGAGDTLEGRALSTTGAVSAYDVLAFQGCGLIALPVELESFTGRCDQPDVVLNWTTGTGGADISYFTVERSKDGTHWAVAGTVKGVVHSSLLNTYSFTDSAPNYGISYYRLNQIDFSGNNNCGTVLSIGSCGAADPENFIVYPNPSAGTFALQFTGDRSQVNSTEIFNLQGAKVFESTGLQTTLDLSGQTPGMYFVQLRTNSKNITHKMMVEK